MWEGVPEESPFKQSGEGGRSPPDGVRRKGKEGTEQPMPKHGVSKCHSSVGSRLGSLGASV